MVNISAWNNTGRNNNDNFLFDLPIKIESLPIFNIYDFETLQNWPKLTPKMLNLGGKLLGYGFSG